MSQQDLADAMDITVDVIRDIERSNGGIADGLVSYANAEGVVVGYEVTFAEESQTAEGGERVESKPEGASE